MNIAALVSGGVDSSVALRLLQEQSHDITAFYLKIWLEDELSYLGDCPWENDLAYARTVCAQAGIRLEVISLQKEYWDEVVSYTIAQVRAGCTPNPDILCNQRIKFGMFWTKVDTHFQKVATGHYAQVVERNGSTHLLRAPDPIKDQTYFLSHLSQEQISRALFPIGHLQKTEVREYAQRYELANRERKDSQGICFLGKLRFRDFIKHYLGEKEGAIVEWETGKKVGTHLGFWFHTVGQRSGLGLSGGPWYVVGKHVDDNVVFVSRSYYDEEKHRNTFMIEKINWIVRPTENQNLQIKLRHGPVLNECTLSLKEDNTALITLSQRDQGIAPGQFAVLYDGIECLGGGVILQEYKN